ncbi:MAG: hypothetical protein ABSD46_01790 [Bacteroidota bacterium]
MTQKIKKVSVTAIVSIAVLLFVLKWILFFHLQDISPTTPNNITGEICPISNHGYIFYVTQWQSYLQFYLLIIPLLFGFIATLLDRRWKVFRNYYEELAKSKLY